MAGGSASGGLHAAQLRGLAKRSQDADQTRRLLALAAIYDGGSRTEAARIGGVGLQTVRDWVLAFNAEGPPGLVNGKAPGNAPLLDQTQRQALRGDRRERPDPGGSRRGALAADRPGAMGVRGIPHLDQQADAEPRIARPGFAQAVGAAAPSCPGRRGAGGVQKNFAASLDEIAERDAAGKPIEIWFQDEARIGQKNKITRRWARRGTRPSAPHDQRTRSAYIFGAICPAQGTAAGLVLPRCNTAAMALHLAEISRTVDAGRPRRAAARSGRLAPLRQARHPRQHHPDAAAAQIARTQPGRKHLAVHARQLALQPRLPILRRHPRPLLLRLEQTRRPAWTIMSIGLRDWAHRF